MKTRINLLANGILMATLSTGFGQSTLQFSAATYTVAESAGAVTLTVQRVNDFGTVVSVDFATADGTATNGLKYTGTSGTLTFAAGRTNQTIEVPILNNALVDGARNFRVMLSNPTNGFLGTRTNATVFIKDNDVGVQFVWATNTVSEGAGLAQVSVVRSDDGTLPITVDLSTSDLTATNGVDYTGTSTTLAFTPAEQFKLVAVPILNNDLKQSGRSFRVSLANPAGASLGSLSNATVTIADNDQGFQFEAASYTVREDAGVLQAVVHRGTDYTNSIVTVDCVTSNGSALYGLDYCGITNTLSFAPGETRQLVTVPILNDGTKEANKFFRLMLSNPTVGAALGTPAVATATILDNDSGLGFELARHTNAWGSSEVVVSVVRGNDCAPGTVAVDYATSDITAKAGVDYQATVGTLEFKANETFKSLPVSLLQNRAAEGTKSFRISLNNAIGTRLGTTSAVVDIVGAYFTLATPFDPGLAIRREADLNLLTWTGRGRLQKADQPAGPWQTLDATQGLVTVQSPASAAFYRIMNPRPARLFVPSGYDGRTQLPLVILLHGAPGTGEGTEAYLKLRPLAESRRFLYCCPDGGIPLGSGYKWNGFFWNATEAAICQYGWADDAGYLRELIEEIARNFALDRKRVYLIGHSNGGAMAHWAACEVADLVAGIASLAGTSILDHHPPSEPVNILAIHGTADSVVSYFDWASTSPNTPLMPGAERLVQIWADFNGASDRMTDPAPSLNLDASLSGLETVVTRYTNCPASGAVELWTINNGSHGPSLSPEFSPRVIDWLLAHPKP